MRFYIVCTFLFVFFAGKSQVFKVVKIDERDPAPARQFIYGLSENENNDPLYKIVNTSDTSDKDRMIYPLSIPDMLDTLKLIEELLSFEGDTRLCALPIRNYNPLSSRVYFGELKRYSIQLEALFIINQLFIEEPFDYSAYPLLTNDRGEQESVKGKLLEEAYRCYKKWFNRVRKMGLQEARIRDVRPLDQSSRVRWY